MHIKGFSPTVKIGENTLFGFKDRLGRKLANWGKYEASKIADHAYQGFSSTVKIGENTTLFVRTEFSMFAFLGQKCQYILSRIVLKIIKSRFLEKLGPNHIFQCLFL